MLPLPPFELVRPRTLEGALEALRSKPGGAKILAGGTDLLANLKKGLGAPERIVSLRGIEELRTVREGPQGELTLGAGVTLAALSAHPLVKSRYPALAEAAALVASPQIRTTATLGGNLCLDTRCVFYDQSAFWRGALGGCLKTGGSVCHIVPGGRRCVAAFSADTPIALLAYGARVEVASADGRRSLPLAELYIADGVHNLALGHDEIVTGVTLDAPRSRQRSRYCKVRARGAIDFPLLSIAVVGTFEADGTLEDLRVSVGGLGARPRLVSRLDALCRGRAIDRTLADAVAERAHAECHPLENLGPDAEWRREVLPVYVRRTLLQLQATR